MGTVTVDRLDATLVVPRSEPRPDETRARLDAVLESRLADACARRFASLDERDGVWLIRELTLDLVIGRRDEQQVAEMFAAEIARALSEAIRAGPDGDRVVFFPTRPAFLAHVCADLAAGRLWSRWYAAAFDGVRALPTGSAIATVLRTEPEHLERALVTMRETGTLDDLLECLTDGDAATVLDAWTFPAVPAADVLAAAASALIVTARHRSSRSSPRDALRMLVAMRSSPSPAPLPEARAAAETVLALAEALAAGGPAVLEDLRAGRIASAARALAGSVNGELVPAVAAALAAGGDWWRSVTTLAMPHPVATPVEGPRRLATAFGGALLLVPALVEAGRETLPAASPEDAAMARLAVLATCLGHERRDAAAADTVVRMLAGVPADRALDDWLASRTDEQHDRIARPFAGMDADEPSPVLPDADRRFLAGGDDSSCARSLAAAARALLDAFARRLLGFRRSSAAYLFRNFLDAGAAVSVDGDAIEAHVVEPPLALVLRMGGASGATTELPWNGLRVIVWVGES